MAGSEEPDDVSVLFSSLSGNYVCRVSQERPAMNPDVPNTALPRTSLFLPLRNKKAK